ncbi:MAG: peptidoglycan DD-metalloendopeptidase family protein [Candidatus Curtissbacteria bacterium]|nr:peptidoglycan DD-metalloendopeptidase family protein [Candidatus Curtissbacteria bacterium]
MKKLLVALFFIAVFLAGSSSTSAITESECDQGSTDSGCVDYFTNKINQLSSQANTLSGQLAQFNSQILLTQVKIADAQVTIDKLEKEIGALGTRIGYIATSVDKLQVLLKQRIVATYQQGFVSNLEIIMSSQNFSDFILRAQYLRQVQENDRKILASLQQTKANYATQKDDREIKQAQIEESQKKLVALKADLDQQKVSKQALLKLTQNDESRYQQLLAAALAEKKAISAAFSDAVSRLNSEEGSPVSQGQTIAVMGNSGAPNCSSGAHLHFMVLKDGIAQNPANYLKNISPVWDNSPDSPFGFSGSWDWPLSGPSITQGFGMTYWARLGWYNGSIHDGIDMVGGPTIVAPRAGKLILGATSCGSSTLKYAAIKHNDDSGIITLYLHIL